MIKGTLTAIVRNIILVSVLSMLGCASVYAQDDADEVIRPISSSYYLELGSSHLCDTYLSPLKYSGESLGLGYIRWRALSVNPEQWVTNLRLGIEFDNADNPAKNSTLVSGMVKFRWAALRRWSVLPNVGDNGLSVGIGPSTSIDAGCLYSDRNSNNPASAKCSWTVDASAYATTRIALWNKPIDLTWSTTLPVAGAFFSPAYGELYYEIYLGDTKGLAHVAYWGNYFRWDNMVSARIHLGSTVLQLGYHCDLTSTYVNHINYRQISHALVIGLGADWLKLSPTKKYNPDALTIPALY